MDNTNKEQQDPQLSGAADPNAMLENYESPILKDYDLMIEYKGLRDSAPSGVYVVPSFSSLRVWHGFIIVHQGWYKDGTFKFRIEFPDDYPEVQPTVKFLTKLYHPFVHQRTLEMHLGWAVKRWNPAKHSILYVLKRLKKMFYVDDFAKYPAVWEPAKKLSLVRCVSITVVRTEWRTGVHPSILAVCLFSFLLLRVWFSRTEEALCSLAVTLYCIIEGKQAAVHPESTRKCRGLSQARPTVPSTHRTW